MSQENARVVRRFVEEFRNTGDVEVAEELLADDFVDHSPFGPMPPDRNGVMSLFAMLRRAFPDLRAEIHDQVSEGDKVVTRKTFTGTHKGEFVGIPPTGREISLGVIDIVAVRDAKMREHWNQLDALGLMTQLGAIPAPG